MDTSNALILAATVFGLTEFGKRFLGPKLAADSRIVALLAIVVGQIAVWLVAETAWARDQFVGGKPLLELNTFSKILVGFFFAATAAFGAELLSSFRSIGQNQPTRVQKAALDAGAERLVAAQYRADQGGSHTHDGEPPKPEPVPFTGVWPPDTPTS